MTDVDDLINLLKTVHDSKTYGGDGYTLEGRAANQLQALLMEIGALKTRVDELLSIKHDLNEQLLETRNELDLHRAGSRG